MTDHDILKIMGWAHRDDFAYRGPLIHAARVYLAQSRHFTARHRGFSFLLLDWAAQCRRRAHDEARIHPAPRVTICDRAPRRPDPRQADFFRSET